MTITQVTNNNIPWPYGSLNFVTANSPVNRQVNPAQKVTTCLSKNNFNTCFPNLWLNLSKRYSVWHLGPTYERSSNFVLLRLSSSCNCSNRRKVQTRKETWCLFEWMVPTRSAEPWGVHLQGQGAQGLRNYQRYRPRDTVSHPRRLDFSEIPLLDHQIPHTGLSKKMDGIWNRYNLKSTGRIYTFGVLKFSEKFKVLNLP